MEESIGLPSIAPTARSLGVRVDKDITVDTDGLVRPGSGGLSVSPDDPRNLPAHRLPPELGGTGKDPVWSINVDDLGDDLSYRPDLKHATHGFIEPATVMTFDKYQDAIGATKPRWQRV